LNFDPSTFKLFYPLFMVGAIRSSLRFYNQPRFSVWGDDLVVGSSVYPRMSLDRLLGKYCVRFT
jgi:hypothetical protein